jgi:hypothetical protein
MRTNLIVIVLLISGSARAGEAIGRHMETAFDLVAMMSAACAQHYEDGLTPKAVATLQFSQGEIAAYCACSTKLVVQNLEDVDFQYLEAGNELPAKFAPALKQAHYACAKKIWDMKHGQPKTP